jgi:hypothetical protein
MSVGMVGVALVPHAWIPIWQWAIMDLDEAVDDWRAGEESPEPVSRDDLLSMARELLVFRAASQHAGPDWAAAVAECELDMRAVFVRLQFEPSEELLSMAAGLVTLEETVP